MYFLELGWPGNDLQNSDFAKLCLFSRSLRSRKQMGLVNADLF